MSTCTNIELQCIAFCFNESLKNIYKTVAGEVFTDKQHSHFLQKMVYMRLFLLVLHFKNSYLFCFSDGSAIFKGCFKRPDNVTLALPASAVIKNMSVDKCVDLCTEKVSMSGLSHTYSTVFIDCPI